MVKKPYIKKYGEIASVLGCYLISSVLNTRDGS